MSRFALFAHSAVPLGLVVLSHSWGAEGALKPMRVALVAPTRQALAGAWHTPSIGEVIHQQCEKPKRRQFAVTLSIVCQRNHYERFLLLALAEKSVSRAPASKSNTPVKASAPEHQPAEQESSRRESPSVLQMLEGHEQDLTIAAAIAVTFFLVGWFCGGIYYLRRDRIRRTKLRF